jgi:hypothetical protein
MVTVGLITIDVVDPALAPGVGGFEGDGWAFGDGVLGIASGAGVVFGEGTAGGRRSAYFSGNSESIL